MLAQAVDLCLSMCGAVRHRKLKWGLAITSMVVMGSGLPFVVAWWHNRKAGVPSPPPPGDGQGLAVPCSAMSLAAEHLMRPQWPVCKDCKCCVVHLRDVHMMTGCLLVEGMLHYMEGVCLSEKLAC